MLMPVASVLPRAIGVTGMNSPSADDFVRQYRAFAAWQTAAFTFC
jgi:hypothetical protein